MQYSKENYISKAKQINKPRDYKGDWGDYND